MNAYASTSSAIMRPLASASSTGSRGLQQCCIDAMRSRVQVRNLSRSASVGAKAGGGKKEAEMGSNEWLQRQLKMVQLVENKKTAPPVTPNSNTVFVNYIPPRSHPFKPFTEDWLVLNWAWLLNWYQTVQATKEDFGLWGFKKQKQAMKEQIIPLYQAYTESKATGNLDSIRSKLSPAAIHAVQETSSDLHSKGLTSSWQLHKINKVSIESGRTVEVTPKQPVTQLAVRFDTMQSLEVRGRDGHRQAGSGDHSQPQRVVENYVFERQAWKGPGAEWCLVEPAPTLTPLQAIGKQDAKFTQVVRPKKRPVLTVV